MCVPSYSALVVKVKNLEKDLKREKLRKEALLQESEVLIRIISQLKNFYQTKPTVCKMHRQCKIDHQRYNLVNN